MAPRQPQQTPIWAQDVLSLPQDALRWFQKAPRWHEDAVIQPQEVARWLKRAQDGRNMASRNAAKRHGQSILWKLLTDFVV